MLMPRAEKYTNQSSAYQKVSGNLGGQPCHSMENRRIGDDKIGILLNGMIKNSKVRNMRCLPPYGTFVVIPFEGIIDLME